MDQIARTPSQVGAAVQRYRKRRGLTQGKLGAKAGLRQATISDLEAGRPAQLATLLDLLAALDLELVIQPRSKASLADIEKSF